MVLRIHRSADFRLLQLSGAACRRIGDVLLLGRGGKWVGRRYRRAERLDDPHGDEVVATVITNADDLVRLSLHAVELGVGYVGVLALAMAGTEFGCRGRFGRPGG